MVKSISVQQLYDILVLNPSLDIIDVRTPAEFAASHISISRQISFEKIQPQQFLKPKNLSSNSSLYLICQTGVRARKAAEKLFLAGLLNVFFVEGGLDAWIAEGFPIIEEKKLIFSLDRQLRIVLGSLILAGVLLAQWIHPLWIWLPGFIGIGLMIAGVTNSCLLQSLIARMPWNQKPPVDIISSDLGSLKVK